MVNKTKSVLDVHMCMHGGANGKTKKIGTCTLLANTAVKICKTEITKHFITLNFYSSSLDPIENCFANKH